MALFRLLLLLALFSPIIYRAAADDGRGIDPNGGRAGNTADAGPRIDPEG